MNEGIVILNRPLPIQGPVATGFTVITPVTAPMVTTGATTKLRFNTDELRLYFENLHSNVGGAFAPIRVARAAEPGPGVSGNVT
jgi:hypothetical protein